MNRTSRFLATAFGMLTLLTLATSSATAQCGGPTKVAFSTRAANARAHLQLAGWPERFEDRWGDERDEFGMEPIVGLWHVNMQDTAKGYADFGYQAWHSDKTEFFNSTKAPVTGAVCQGVWEKVGRSTFQLNHFALGYNGTGPTEATPAQIVHIREIVTVDASRKHFEGKFLVEVYTYTDHKLLVSFSGPVTANRITIDTPLSAQ